MKIKRSRRERETREKKKDEAKEDAPVVVETEYKRLYFGPEEPTLQLECWEEALSEIQMEVFKKADEEHKSIKDKFDAIVKESGGEVIFSGDQCLGYTLTGNSKDISELTSHNAEVLARSRSKSGDVIALSKKKSRKDKDKDKGRDYEPEDSPVKETKKEKKKKNKESKDTTEVKSKKEKDSTVTTPTSTTRSGRSASKSAVADVQTVSGVRPSEASAVGGLATGGGRATPVVDLTRDDKNQPDSKEVSFNKLQGKTFPSLVVVARPYLRAGSTGTPPNSNSDRAQLDGKVKAVLMHTPTKFTEWLIQQGLVRAEQHCLLHPSQKLKLGMYSDVSKFPYSGGYVWISECCPTRFVSVFSGSLFEGATHPPSVLLKLIYHWACQTNVQNVVQWVKVDNLYVKGLFTWLRAACTAGLQEHVSPLGGNGRKVEVGVISLGTTSHDGTQRQVKVEVLGILDTEAKLIRLRAVEPLADGERNYKKRFQKILEPLATWVQLDSVILTDLTVDKGTLVNMGFRTVHQVSNSDSNSKNSNSNIMEYLRRIVPRMFQNTLSLLSRQIIQQFLDELVWREIYGTTAGQAFDNIVTQLAEQTRLDAKDGLAVRLSKISTNPFKNWRYATRSAAEREKAAAAARAAAEAESADEGKRGRAKRARKERSPSPPASPPPSPPAAPRRSRADRSAAKEAKKEAPRLPEPVRSRRKRKINYTEDDDDEEDLLPLASRKQVKKEKKEKKSSLDGEDLPLKIKKERDEPMIDMEGFYFGKIVGTPSRETCKISVQCPRCYEDFSDNITLLDHMLQHANGDMGNMCRFCVTSQTDTNHDALVHPIAVKATLGTFGCLICETRVNTVVELSKHLQRRHNKMELPFVCSVAACGYRSSARRTTINHFYEAHANSDQLQCPHCLKIVCVYSDGHELRTNVQLFLKHLLQHRAGDDDKKCGRCSLCFVHEGAMKDHQVRHHGTVEGTVPLCSEKHLITKPKAKPRPPVRDSKSHTIVESLDNVTLVVPDGMLCRECDTHIDDDKHYLGLCRCTRCDYKSACHRAMLQHCSSCIAGMEPATKTILPAAMYCVCSFSTDNAEVLLNHLVTCDKQSAYPTIEDAEVNKVDEPVVSNAENEGNSSRNEESNIDDFQAAAQDDGMNEYPPTPSINTQLALDDLAPPSVLQQDQMEMERLKNDAYEQPLATPQAALPPDSPLPLPVSMRMPLHSSLDSYMDTGEFEPLPAEPPPQPEFEPL